MNLLPSQILYKGWLPFFKGDRTIISVWFLLVSSTCFLFGLLNFQRSALILLTIIIFRKIVAGGFCCSNKKLHGQTVIITGSNTGIGKETAKELAIRGANVILACRDMTKAEKVALQLKSETGSEVTAEKLDLSSFESIKSFAHTISITYSQVHCLINNAGIMMCPYIETEEGHEMQMGVNHFGHFLLTSLLLPLIKKGHEARIINVSSVGHRIGTIPFEDFHYNNGYSSIQAYANSKLANILHARHLSKILKGSNVQVFSLHPGVVHSELARHLPFNLEFIYLKFLWLFAKTPREGAQTTVYCATEAVQQPTFYFSDCVPDKPSLEALSDEMAEKLWKVSDKIVGVAK